MRCVECGLFAPSWRLERCLDRLSFFWPRRWLDPHYALSAGLGEEQWGASELRASTVPPRSAMSGGRTGTRSARAKPCSDCASSCPIFREQAIEPIAGTHERSATKVFRAGLSTPGHPSTAQWDDVSCWHVRDVTRPRPERRPLRVQRTYQRAAYGAVNAVSLYVERGRETFDAVHVEAAARVARLARENGVERLIHVSGIGADPASSAPYIAARGRGEIAVQQAFPCAILIRPAVMFGPDDAFLTTVVRLLQILPVYPIFGRGETKLQPVYVEDVAEGIARVLADAGGSAASYEFAGARVYTYKELVRTVADRIKGSPKACAATIFAMANSRLGGRVPARFSSYPQSGGAHAARQYRFRGLPRLIEPGHRTDGNRNARICIHGLGLKDAIRGRLSAAPSPADRAAGAYQA